MKNFIFSKELAGLPASLLLLILLQPPAYAFGGFLRKHVIKPVKEKVIKPVKEKVIKPINKQISDAGDSVADAINELRDLDRYDPSTIEKEAADFLDDLDPSNLANVEAAIDKLDIDLSDVDVTDPEVWDKIESFIDDAHDEAYQHRECYYQMSDCIEDFAAQKLYEHLAPKQLKEIFDRNFGHNTNRFDIERELRQNHQIVILGPEIDHDEYKQASAAAVSSYFSGGSTGLVYLEDLAKRQYIGLLENSKKSIQEFVESEVDDTKNDLVTVVNGFLEPTKLAQILHKVITTGRQPEISLNAEISDFDPRIRIHWLTFYRSEQLLSEEIPLPNTHKIAITIDGIPVLSSTSKSKGSKDSEPSEPINQKKSRYGHTELSAGFMPDPLGISVIGDGHSAGGDSIYSCQGHDAHYNSEKPDYTFQWNSSTPFKLSAKTEIENDLALIVRYPNGRKHCFDDFEGSLNPVAFIDAGEGHYEIWVGTISEQIDEEFALSITERF